MITALEFQTKSYLLIKEFVVDTNLNFAPAF